MTRQVRRAFKYRFYPSETQAAELARTFGCVRKVYNLALAARTDVWSVRGEKIGYEATSALLTAWKKTEELAFLNDVSSVPLQQSLRHLQAAFANFFAKRARHPRYKSKRNARQAAEYTKSAFRYQEGVLRLARMAEPLDVVWSRPLPRGTVPSTVTVSRDGAGRWFVSILVVDESVEELPPTDRVVGIDAGITSLLTLSTGEKIANPRHERRERKALARAQRELSRKQQGSNNRERARVRVARIHARIADRRGDLLHKVSTRLVRENQTLVIEDLPVSALLGNRVLSRAISDASWSRFRGMLEYKAQWYGRQVIAVDRWFPSSKLCSGCGTPAAAMPLDVRVWRCGACGVTHDRDVNAAKNILAAGLAVSACGAGVSPRRSNPDRLPALKQEVVPPRRHRAAAQPRG